VRATTFSAILQGKTELATFECANKPTVSATALGVGSYSGNAVRCHTTSSNPDGPSSEQAEAELGEGLPSQKPSKSSSLPQE
jgi:hypothetical protein